MTELREDVIETLELLYGEAAAPAIANRLERLVASYRGRIPAPARQGWSQRDALLITYGDSIVAGNTPPAAVLQRFLQQEVGERISFVHLLPFYPWTSDDGFSVVDYRAVNEAVGDWEDIAALAAEYRLVFDAVINHVSQESAYVRGMLADEPAFRDFAIALPEDTDTRSVLRTRNLPLLHDYDKHDGSKVWLWTTFSRDQVDLNFGNPEVLIEIVDVLLFYAAHGACMLRLDAIPYLWKQLGTSCAHLPETHAIIKMIRRVLDAVAPHVLLLTETNVPHHENVAYFGDAGDEAQMIYNFSLAPLILFAIVTGDATHLTAWASQVRRISDRATFLNITATHDGIGMRPTEGILSEPERQLLVDLASRHHGDVTGKRNADGSISPYELNLSYFDAVNDPDADEAEELQIARFMLSQAIPLSFIGVPGIYLHSLLGSRNDLAGVQRTGRARSINREQLELDQVSGALHDAKSLRGRVFRAYCRLLDLRANEPALHPDADQEILDLGPDLFVLRRTSVAGDQLHAVHNVTGWTCRTEIPQWAGGVDLIADEQVPTGTITLAPYQVRWLRR